MGLPVGLGMLCAPIFVGIFGLLLEVSIIRRFYNATIVAMLATYAIGLIIRELTRGALAGRFWKVSEPIPGLFQIGDMGFSIWRGVIIIITIFVMYGCYYFLTKTLWIENQRSNGKPLFSKS